MVTTEQTLLSAPVDRTFIALDGGMPSVTEVLPKRSRWGAEELAELTSMLQQDSLFYWHGPKTALLVERFQQHYPLDFVMPCSSGTAALHIAVAAAGIGPGHEVITSPVTDMGTVIGILYQQGVPVFADLEPHTYNLDVEDVRRKITPRTRAIIAVHLAGNPCDMHALRALADEHDLVLIEDCAQAWGALYRAVPVGTIGHIGCWSLNDYKHISCGDGGIVATSDQRFGPLLQKFGDKSYDRENGARFPDSLAPNYRISEPQAAIAAAQMLRIGEVTEPRVAAGRLLSALLADIPGIMPHHADSDNHWTVWFYLFRIDLAAFRCDLHQFSAALQAEGVPASPGYIGHPLYKYPVFQNHAFFAGRWPVREMGLTSMDYSRVYCPQAEAILESCIQLPISEVTTESWVRQVAAAIRRVAFFYQSP